MRRYAGRRRFMLLVAWLAAAGAIWAGAGSAPQQSAGVRPLPHRDYSLVVPAGPDRLKSALERLRGGMMTALAESGLLPAAFPEAGTLLRTPSAAEARVAELSCSATSAAEEGGKCIRLGPTAFLELASLDYPSARGFLFEVFLFDKLPGRAPSRDVSFSLLRVVVHHPILEGLPPVPGREVGEILDALQRGLLIAGARPIQTR
jgi:hypothetical protein